MLRLTYYGKTAMSVDEIANSNIIEATESTETTPPPQGPKPNRPRQPDRLFG
jgi:hypothetical protein